MLPLLAHPHGASGGQRLSSFLKKNTSVKHRSPWIQRTMASALTIQRILLHRRDMFGSISVRTVDDSSAQVCLGDTVGNARLQQRLFICSRLYFCRCDDKPRIINGVNPRNAWPSTSPPRTQGGTVKTEFINASKFCFNFAYTKNDDTSLLIIRFW